MQSIVANTLDLMSEPGQTDDFLRLYTRCQRQIYVYLRARLRNASDVDDVVQQVATVLWQKFDEYFRDQDFARWALGIARLECLKWRKVKGRLLTNFQEELADLVDNEILACSESADIRSDALQKCLEKVLPTGRAMLAQRYESNKSVAEIARAYQRTESAVYKSLQKIHDSLYECVENALQRRPSP
jgi:RNA polymerase sigma-70 factor, ECF subfamily